MNVIRVFGCLEKGYYGAEAIYNGAKLAKKAYKNPANLTIHEAVRAVTSLVFGGLQAGSIAVSIECPKSDLDFGMSLAAAGSNILLASEKAIMHPNIDSVCTLMARIFAHTGDVVEAGDKYFKVGENIMPVKDSAPYVTIFLEIFAKKVFRTICQAGSEGDDKNLEDFREAYLLFKKGEIRNIQKIPHLIAVADREKFFECPITKRAIRFVVVPNCPPSNVQLSSLHYEKSAAEQRLKEEPDRPLPGWTEEQWAQRADPVLMPYPPVQKMIDAHLAQALTAVPNLLRRYHKQLEEADGVE